MSVRGDILNALLTEYRQKRDDNAALSMQRLEQAAQICPEIKTLHDKRRHLLIAGLRSVMEGQEAPVDEMEAADGRIRALLTGNGFPADFLHPVYTCPVCHDTGYTGESVRDMCACLKAVYHSRLFDAVGLRESEPQTFSSFNENIFSDEVIAEIGCSQREAARVNRRIALAYAESFPDTDTPDLLLLGKAGTGKTFLMHAMARRVLERGYQVQCVSAYKAFEMARSAHKLNDPEEMRTLMEAELLLVDDLGTEPMMENITLPYLFNLINERQQANLKTIFSTNLSKDNLKERYTERIASRLLNPMQCRILAFAGGDVRKRSGA